MEIKKFKDIKIVYEPPYPNAIKVMKENLIGKEIIIREVKEFPSSMQENATFFVILAQLPDNPQMIYFNGSPVIDDQIRRVKDQLPISATIIKVKNKYYSLS